MGSTPMESTLFGVRDKFFSDEKEKKRKTIFAIRTEQGDAFAGLTLGLYPFPGEPVRFRLRARCSVDQYSPCLFFVFFLGMGSMLL